MKLKDLLDITRGTNILSIEVEDRDANPVCKFSARCYDDMALAFKDWYVVFVDFNAKQVNVAPVPYDYMGD